LGFTVNRHSFGAALQMFRKCDPTSYVEVEGHEGETDRKYDAFKNKQREMGGI